MALVVSVAVAGVAAYNRLPWSDEGWFSSASYNLAKHGFFGTTVLETAGTHLTRIQQHTYWVMPLFPLGQALWYKLFPTTMFSTRAFTILCIPFALWAFQAFLAKLIPDTRAPALGFCLLALSFVFIDNAAFARPDVMCCTFGLGGLAVYLLLRERSLGWALFLSNAFIAASGLTHPNGIFHFVALLTLVLWYDWRRLSPSGFVAAAAPYVLFGSAWMLYILQDYPAFVDQMRENGMNGRWTLTLNPLAIVWNEIRERYLVVFGFVTRGFALAKALALFAYLAAVAGCLASSGLRKRPSTRLLLLLLAVYFAAMSVFNQKLSYYLIHILPIYIALLSVWIVWLWDSYPRLRSLLAVAVILLMAVETGGILLKAHRRSYRATQRAMVDYLRSRTLPSDRIVGTAALLYEMGFDPRLRDDCYLGLRSGRASDAIVIEELYRIQYAAWSTERPADMRRIRERLSKYVLAYRNDDYDVYLRPGR